MERRICTHYYMEKNILKTFTTNIQNVRFVNVIEVKNVIMKKKIKYQINESILWKKQKWTLTETKWYINKL